MSKCDLRIELDRDPPHYQAGETVKGAVIVDVNADCPCKALTAKLAWRTHGKGNQAEGAEQEDLLGGFQWKAGQQAREEFAFQLPKGPVSYHGHLINVDWYVNARADIPWAIDPKAEQDLLVSPAPAGRQAQEGYRAAPKAVAQAHVLGTEAKKAQSPVVKFIGVMVMIGFVWIFFGEHIFDDGEPNWILLAFLVFFFGMMFRMVFKDLRNIASKRKLGDIKVSTEPQIATKAERLTVRVQLSPKSSLSINEARVKLVGQEIAVRGSGTSKKTYRHTLASRSAELGRDLRINTGESRELITQLTLPDDAAPTFRASDNDVRWQVEVYVDIANWPDFEQIHEIEVHPS